MILKNILIVSVICIVLAKSFTTAQDVCISCSEKFFSSFLNCLTTKLYQNGFLSGTSEAEINDTKESIIIAVDILPSKKNQFKERVMMGVLATEMCELLSNDESMTQFDVILQGLSGSVRQCYNDVTGETNEKFFYEFESLVNSILKRSPPEENESESIDASQSLTAANADNFGGTYQNSNGLQKPTNYVYPNAQTTNFESNNANRQQNLPFGIPIFQPNELQTRTASASIAENQNNYSPFNRQQTQTFSASREYAAAKPETEYRNDAPTNKDNTAINSFRESQIQENQNSYNGAAAVASSMYRENASPQQQISPQQYVDSVQPAIFSRSAEESFNITPFEKYPSSETKQENSPLDIQYPNNDNQYQENSLDYNTDDSKSDKSTIKPSSSTVHKSSTSNKKHRKKHRNSQKKRRKANKQENPKSSSNEVDEKASKAKSMDYSTSTQESSAAVAIKNSRDDTQSIPLTMNEPQQVISISDKPFSTPEQFNSYPTEQYFEYINPQQRTSSKQISYKPDNSKKFATSNPKDYSRYTLSSTKAPKKSRSNSKKKEEKLKEKQTTAIPNQKVTKSDYALNANNSPGLQDFQELSNLYYSKRKALEFGKTIFVVLSKNELFCQSFNKDTTNINAQLLTYQIVRKGMKQCGYFNISNKMAHSCRQAINSVKEGSSTQLYSQTIAKAIMIYFHKNRMIEDDSKNQAKNVALAMIQFLPKGFYSSYRNLQDQRDQDGKQSARNAESQSEVNNYSFETNAENALNKNSATEAESTTLNFNTEYTEMETKTNGQSIGSYSGEYNYEYDNNMNDTQADKIVSKEAEYYDYSNYEGNEANGNYNNDNIKTITKAPTNDETEYECNEIAENGEYTSDNNEIDARESVASNEVGEYDYDQSNSEENEEENLKNDNSKAITMAPADDEPDYECNETAETEEYTYKNDEEKDNKPNDYNINTLNESKTYRNYQNEGSNKENRSNDEKTERSSRTKPIVTYKPRQKKRSNTKKNKRNNKKSNKNYSSAFQNRSNTQRKTEEVNKASESMNRIDQLRLASMESAFGGKFDYELFMRELSRLIVKANNGESAWTDEGKVFDVLMEAIVALTQLIAQNSATQSN